MSKYNKSKLLYDVRALIEKHNIENPNKKVSTLCISVEEYEVNGTERSIITKSIIRKQKNVHTKRSN